jgi:hypothetical protein
MTWQVVERGFGSEGHAFQYLFAYGHKPKRREVWPQPGAYLHALKARS